MEDTLSPWRILCHCNNQQLNCTLVTEAAPLQVSEAQTLPGPWLNRFPLYNRPPLKPSVLRGWIYGLSMKGKWPPWRLGERKLRTTVKDSWAPWWDTDQLGWAPPFILLAFLWLHLQHELGSTSPSEQRLRMGSPGHGRTRPKKKKKI